MYFQTIGIDFHFYKAMQMVSTKYWIFLAPTILPIRIENA